MSDRKYVTPTGAEVEINEDNYIETEVVLELNNIVDTNLEGFLDMLSLGATDTEILSDIEYTIERLDPWGGLIFSVRGDISLILDEED